jgi:protoporphyrin/coproporphyrin ferrochelatase
MDTNRHLDPTAQSRVTPPSVKASPRGTPPKTGVLLVNLGTPDAPTTGPVRRYLREFLSDPRVLTLPAPLRFLLLNLIILPTRPRKSAAAYAKIWTQEGSPLLVHSENLTREVGKRLGESHSVRLGMRYGSPSIASGIEQLKADGVDRIIVLPLFPQYTSAVTASVSAKVFECLADETDIPAIEIVGAFYDEPDFADSWAAAAGPGLEDFGADHVLFSFHGLPANQIRASDPQTNHCLASPDCCAMAGPSLPRCYRAQCFATADALIETLGLDAAQTTTSFQSRLGNTPWIEPYTDQILGELYANGARRLAVLCPAFVADCLETLEEVGIRLRAEWLAIGGEELWLAPCPNSDPRFADAVAAWISRRGREPRP